MIRRVIHIKGCKRYSHINSEMNAHYPGDYELMDAVVNTMQPHKGISDSFKKAIDLHYNEDMIHVLEDDVKFTSNRSRKVFDSLIEKLPDDWDMLLGGCYYLRIEKYYDGFVKLKEFSSLHSVIFRKKMYDKLLGHDGSGNIDFYLSNLSNHGKLNAYMAYPMLAIQISGYSFRSRMNVDYSNKLKPYKLLE